MYMVNDHHVYWINCISKKSVRSYKSVSSRRSSADQNFLDLLLPRPVFKWKDPTNVPRFCHKTEFKDLDISKVPQNTPQAVVQNIVQRQKFHDGKIRSQSLSNLISVVRGNGLSRNAALFQNILNQRGTVPIWFDSEVEPEKLDSHVNALEFCDVSGLFLICYESVFSFWWFWKSQTTAFKFSFYSWYF